MEGKKLTDLFPNTNIEYLFHSLNTFAKPYGVSFSGADSIFNTQLALMAAEYAKEKGKGNEFHGEVFRKYFTGGRNVAEEQTLSEIASAVGLDGEEMLSSIQNGDYQDNLREAKREVIRYEVCSTPTFIIDEKYKIVGAQPIHIFREALDQKSY